jgi:hypothetical protein
MKEISAVMLASAECVPPGLGPLGRLPEGKNGTWLGQQICTAARLKRRSTMTGNEHLREVWLLAVLHANLWRDNRSERLERLAYKASGVQHLKLVAKVEAHIPTTAAYTDALV